MLRNRMKHSRKWWEERTLRCFNAKLLETASHCHVLKSNVIKLDLYKAVRSPSDKRKKQSRCSI